MDSSSSSNNSLQLFFFFFLLLFFFRTTFQQQSAQLGFRADQRAALIQIRASLGIRTKDWPIKSEPCIDWIGVQCQNGSVIGINISGFKRTRIGGENPRFSVNSLGNLTELVSFNASRFTLLGSIPDWLGFRLRELRVLDLRFCGISGGIPSSIGNLTNLVELYLSDNDLTGGIPVDLGRLSRLSVLDLSRNSITGLIPADLGSLGELSQLDISSNTLYGVIPEQLGSLLKLKSLNLSGNGLSYSVPARFGGLSSLVVLDLSSNSLTGSLPLEFGSLRSLQRMVIFNNRFTGDLPDALWLLPNLSFLDASSNSFNGFLPNVSLDGNNTTMAVFNLSHNMFCGFLTSVLKSVGFVDLSYNFFQGKVPDYARNVASLDRNCFSGWSSQRNMKECAGFYSRKGLPFDYFGLPIGGTLRRPPSGDRKTTNRRVVVFAAVLGTVGLVLLFVISVVLLMVCSCSRREPKTTKTRSGPGPDVTADTGAPGEAFGYEKILAATGDFNDANLVKNGHSANVFKGVLEGGIHIIVKRFDLHSRKNNCRVELDFFSKVSHPRLVPLLGHCLEKEKEKYLIYKYMPKGDLSSSLYTENGSDDDGLKSLDWITRLKIAIGVAEGLSYLHHECVPPLVHRDVQAGSILLDDKYEVRLGSLGEACIQETDSHSNMITRLLRLTWIFEEVASGVATATCTYDVYCFGKVLLELVTGKIGISASNDSTTKEALEGLLPFISIHDKELMKIIIDPSLIVDDDLLEEVWAMAVIAKSCLNPKPSRRPLMRFVLKALENPLKVVREGATSSAKVGTSSSWNGSWRHSLAAGCGGGGGSKGELQGGEDGCLSTRRHSKDVFPEPTGVEDAEIWNKE